MHLAWKKIKTFRMTAARKVPSCSDNRFIKDHYLKWYIQHWKIGNRLCGLSGSSLSLHKFTKVINTQNYAPFALTGNWKWVGYLDGHPFEERIHWDRFNEIAKFCVRYLRKLAVFAASKILSDMVEQLWPVLFAYLVVCAPEAQVFGSTFSLTRTQNLVVGCLIMTNNKSSSPST